MLLLKMARWPACTTTFFYSVKLGSRIVSFNCYIFLSFVFYLPVDYFTLIIFFSLKVSENVLNTTSSILSVNTSIVTQSQASFQSSTRYVAYFIQKLSRKLYISLKLLTKLVSYRKIQIVLTLFRSDSFTGQKVRGGGVFRDPFMISGTIWCMIKIFRRGREGVVDGEVAVKDA